MNRVLATDLQHVAGVPLPAITDEVMHERLRAARPYTVVLLHATSQLVQPDADPIIWEHGRRNFALREHGVLPIVLPATDDNDLAASTFSTHRQMTFARSWTTTPDWPPASSPTKSIRSVDSPAPAFLSRSRHPGTYRDPADCDATEQGPPPDPAVTGPRGPRLVTPPGHV
jgi:hypothetical protein